MFLGLQSPSHVPVHEHLLLPCLLLLSQGHIPKPLKVTTSTLMKLCCPCWSLCLDLISVLLASKFFHSPCHTHPSFMHPCHNHSGEPPLRLKPTPRLYYCVLAPMPSGTYISCLHLQVKTYLCLGQLFSIRSTSDRHTTLRPNKDTHDPGKSHLFPWLTAWRSDHHGFINANLEGNGQGSEMAQWIQVFVAEADNLGLTPGTHMIKGENQLPKVVLWPLYECQGSCARAHTHEINFLNLKRNTVKTASHCHQTCFPESSYSTCHTPEETQNH